VEGLSWTWMRQGEMYEAAASPAEVLPMLCRRNANAGPGTPCAKILAKILRLPHLILRSIQDDTKHGSIKQAALDIQTRKRQSRLHLEQYALKKLHRQGHVRPE
jgi:hypothetical protein